MTLFCLVFPGTGRAQDIEGKPAKAQDVENSVTFGLSMHGAPKYGAGSAHLDYANPDAPKSGTLRQAAIGTFDSVNPFAIKGKPAQGLGLVHDRLTARVRDEPFTLYPLIAQRLETPEDRSSLTVHIDPRARFSDGSAITAEDVIFSFETLRAQGRPNMRQVYKLAQRVETPDAMTVRFVFGPGYDRETAMIFAMMPVLSKKWWEGKPFDSATLTPPVASGPYKIAQVEPGRRIVYERNPDYWAANIFPNKGLYNLDRIVYDYYRDDTVAFESFKAGDLDYRREFDIAKWSTGYDFPAVRAGKARLETLAHGRPERARSLIFNTRRPPFDDIRVREALSLLPDFAWINKTLFYGKYKRINSFYPNSELAAQEPQPSAPPSEAQMRRNLREADRLLKQAGWTVTNGVRSKDGKPFSFEILAGAPEDEKIALAFVRNLERMGIHATVRALDSAAFIDRLNGYDYDMLLYDWISSLSPGTEQALFWGCEAGKQPARWNYAGICDPRIDALAAAIPETKSRAELVADVKALDRLLMEGHYAIPLFYPGADFVAYRTFLHHPQAKPVYGLAQEVFGNVLETWWAEPDAGKPGRQTKD